MSTPSKNHSTAYLLALAGVLIFSFTLPFTKYAIVHGLNPLFIAFGRTVLAGLIALTYLLIKKQSIPDKTLWRDISLSSMGVVIAFPLFSSLALKTVPSSHAIVFGGLLPLATAAIASQIFHQKQPRSFWVIALLAAIVIVVYNAHHVGFDWSQIELADGWMLLAVGLCAVGYAYGARVSSHMSSVLSICWALVFALPITIPITIWVALQQTTWPTDVTSWVLFGYLSVMSQLVGFFFWYRGLSLGGTAKVSQVQLSQTLLSLVWATFIFNEPSDWTMWATVSVTIFLIYLSKKVGR